MISFVGEYLQKIEEYRIKDKSLQFGYHKHHIIPRCCGGTDDESNIVKVSINHHVWLHKIILNSIQGINEVQRDKLKYASEKMIEKYIDRPKPKKKINKPNNKKNQRLQDRNNEINTEYRKQLSRLYKLESEYKSKRNIDTSLLKHIQAIKKNLRDLSYDKKHHTRKYKYYPSKNHKI